MPTGTFSGTLTVSYTLTVNPTTITAAGTINAPAAGVYGYGNTAWTLISYGMVSGRDGVRLGKGGGLVVNGAATATDAAILSTNTGIYMAGTGHVVGTVYSFGNTVVNYGTIRNTGTGDGVQIVTGGALVTNRGLLSSGGDAVYVRGLSGSVVNHGTVITSSTGANAAVYLATGSVNNRRGGLIRAPNTAVSIKSFGYVLNDGTVKSTNGTGIDVAVGGSVTNTSDGVISGGAAGIDLEGIRYSFVTSAGAGSATMAASDSGRGPSARAHPSLVSTQDTTSPPPPSRTP